MKIAILTSGILPVPAVQGGAVENLIDFYLEYNDRHHLHDITVYSIAHDEARKPPAPRSADNHYHYIDVAGKIAKVRKRLFRILHTEGYYHYTIEYYLHMAMRHAFRQDYDMIILENRPGYALRLSGKTRSRIVIHLHNDILNSSTLHAREIFLAATRIISVSRFVTSRVMTIEADAERCVTVYNGIDTTKFSPASATPPSRTAYGLDDDDFVLIFTGRVIREKGIAELIDAMSLIGDTPRIRLLVVGSSFYGNAMADDPFITMLKEKAATLGQRLLFTGFTPYAQMPSMLALADVAVLPSMWEEPLGLTCLEAMAMGLPVITTDRGGIPETVTADSGIIIHADDHVAEHLATSILRLYHDRNLCRKMGDNGIKAARNFSKEAYAENFFNAIQAK